jgi:iron complex transport system ATP-binding protein
MSAGLVVSGATVRAGENAILDGVSFAARAGALTGLIGPNGAGKSTLMRAALGLVPLDTGSISFEGADLPGMKRRARAQLSAFVEQSGVTEVHLTAREVVLLGRIPFQSVWQSAPSPADDHAVDEALAAVEMTDLGARLYHTLSGGEQQRLQIARALAQQPQLLILDEPTNHLDVHAQLAILSLLRRRAQAGATVLLALHDLNLAASFCDALVVLNRGRQVAKGTPDEVLTPALLRSVYEVDATLLRHPGTGRPMIAYDLPA